MTRDIMRTVPKSYGYCHLSWNGQHVTSTHFYGLCARCWVQLERKK